MIKGFVRNNVNQKSTETTFVGVSIARTKKNAGITLVALVVTIIVLLILARSDNINGAR